MSTTTAAAAPAAPAPPTPIHQPKPHIFIASDALRESPFNPRQVFDPVTLGELAVSIKTTGLLQPVIARAIAKGKTTHELVFGHRRYRAGKLAGLAEFPVIVVAMTDEEVIDAQLIENHQRVDVHPLEEADQFRLLHVDHKRSAIEIGARIGLSKEYVYARMKLCALSEAGRKAFLGGKLSTSTALLVARIPDKKQQDAAVKELTEHLDGDGPVGARTVSKHLQEKYMLRLAVAPFDIKDAKLVPAAGACTVCPKNSATERALFSDVDAKAGDLCTDPACYDRKCDADFGKQATTAKAAGAKILDDDKAKKLFYNDGRLVYDAPVINIDDKCERDPKGRSYRKLLAGVASLPVVLARDHSRKPHELLEVKAVDALLKKAGHEFKKTPAYGQGEDYKKAEAKRRAEDARKRDGNKASITALVVAAEKGEADVRFLRVIMYNLMKFSIRDALADAVKRRGLHVKGKRPEQAVEPRIASMTAAELRGWIVEITTLRFGLKSSDSFGGSLSTACKSYGLDAKALSSAAVKQLQAEKDAKKKPAAVPAKKTAKAKAPAKKKPSAAKPVAKVVKTHKKAKGK